MLFEIIVIIIITTTTGFIYKYEKRDQGHSQNEILRKAQFFNRTGEQ